MRKRLVVFIVLVVPCCLRAQAQPECATRPQTFAAMHGCYRPLLVFAPASNDARFVAQVKALDAAADDMINRNLLLVPVLTENSKFKRPRDAPYSLLPAAELVVARRRYRVASGDFRVVLLGEDGGVKLDRKAPVAIDELNALIDSMPMRRQEMQRPQAN